MSEKRHQFAANQGPLSSTSNDIDRLSSKADYGSDSESSLGCDETSDSSPSYRGSPVPFDLAVKGIAGWTEGAMKFEENLQPNVESLLSETIGEHATATSGEKQKVAATQAHLGITALNDIDKLSSKADCGSGSEDPMSCGEASDSSTPHRGSPAPFDFQVKGIAGWTEGSAKSIGNRQRGEVSLIASNFEEAKSGSLGCGQALEKMMGYESAMFKPTNTSVVSRRHYLDTVGDAPNANAKWKKLESDRFEKVASVSQNSSGSRLAKHTTSDPEKQEPIDGARTSQYWYHYGGAYTILKVALVLGIVLYGLEMLGGFRCF